MNVNVRSKIKGGKGWKKRKGGREGRTEGIERGREKIMRKYVGKLETGMSQRNHL